MAHFVRERTNGCAFNNSGRHVLLRAAALLALGCAPLAFAGDDGNDAEFVSPKPQKADKPTKNKLVKNADGGWVDSSYQPVDSFGKVDASRNASKMMGADAGLSPEEMHAKYLKNLQDQQEKMKKLQQEMEKKALKQKQQREKDQKDGKSTSREIVVPGNGSRVLEFSGENKDRRPAIIEPTKSADTRRTIEIGSGKGTKTNSFINDEQGDGVDTLKPGSMVRLPVKGEPPKRSFWDKLTGRNKDETAKINIDEDNGRMSIEGSDKATSATGDAKSFTPRSSEYRSTATQRLADIMERKRLQNGPVAGAEAEGVNDGDTRGNSKDFEAKKAAALAAAANAGAEVIDLPGEKKVEPETADAPAVPTRVPEPRIGELAEAVDPLALPETDFDTQIEAERAYR